MYKVSYKSAGILPYAYVPRTNNIYFLLGQEMFDPRWFASDRWSDFGGTVKANEDEMMCAAREFVEETMGIVLPDVAMDLNNPSTVDVAHMHQQLQDKSYLYRVECITEAVKNTHTHVRKSKICYLKRIPWQPHLPEVFRLVNSTLRRLSILSTPNSQLDFNEPLQTFWLSMPTWLQTHPAVNVTRENDKILTVSVNPEWLEKQQIGWWSLPRLRAVIKNGGRFKKQMFRYGFLSTLSMILDKFTQNDTSNRFFAVDMHPRFHQQAIMNSIANVPSENSNDIQIVLPSSLL